MNKQNVIDEVARHLVRQAARNAPPPLAERLEEEWLADLATRQGPVSRLLLGLGCCWATKTIVAEHCALNVSTAKAVAGSTTMTVQAQSEPTFLPRRTTAVAAIIGVHVLVIYAFSTGLGHQFVRDLQTPFVADFLQEPTAKNDPPPPPKIDMIRPKIDPVTTTVIIDGEPRATALTPDPAPTIADPGIPQLAPAPVAVKRVLGGPGKGFPNTEDYYPPAAIRLGEQGKIAVQVCVDPNGKLTGTPKITQSSGNVRLDEGAIKLATAGSGHYRATTENGAPVSSCYGYLIRFDLK